MMSCYNNPLFEGITDLSQSYLVNQILSSDTIQQAVVEVAMSRTLSSSIPSTKIAAVLLKS